MLPVPSPDRTTQDYVLQGASSWIKVANGAPFKKKPNKDSAEISGPMYFACPGLDDGLRAKKKKSVRFSDDIAAT